MKEQTIKIDKSEFDVWMNSPVTSWIFQTLKERMDELVGQIINGRESNFDDYCKNQWRKGVVDGYTDLLATSFEDFEEMEDKDNV